MSEILTGSIVIILLHALLPNHWLPVISIGRQQNWSVKEVSRITLLVGLAHSGSTVLIGMVLGLLGLQIQALGNSLKLAGPVLLILLGLWFMYRHHKHHHFQVKEPPLEVASRSTVVWTLTVAMFLSPCLEIEAYFLLAGQHGLYFILLLALLYTLITVVGMLLWVRTMYYGLLKVDWHLLEHNAGLITGFTLIATGLWGIFVE